MSISKNPYKRYRIIDGLLRRRHYPSKREILEKLEEEGYPIADRTFDNDIECLRSKMSLPIEYDRYHNGYYYTEEGVGLDISFTDDELELIWLAVSSLSPFQRSSAVRGLRTSIEQLMHRMDIDVKEESSLPSKVLFDKTNFSSLQYRNLAMVMDALYHKLSIEITLPTDMGQNAKPKKISLDHIQLEEEDGNWTVKGYNNNKPIEIELNAIYKVNIESDNLSKMTA